MDEGCQSTRKGLEYRGQELSRPGRTGPRQAALAPDGRRRGIRVYGRLQRTKRSREAYRSWSALCHPVGARERRGCSDRDPCGEPFIKKSGSDCFLCKLHYELHHASRGDYVEANRRQEGHDDNDPCLHR